MTAAATAAVLLIGLAGGGPAFAAPAAPAGLQQQFAAAAKEFKVPAGLLLAVSYQQTRWESHQGLPSTTGNYNVMGLTQVDLAAVAAAQASAVPEVDLRDEGGPAKARKAPAATPAAPVDGPALHTLDAAARLTGRPAAELRTDPLQSIRGAAALLADYQRAAGGKQSADPADWYQAVVRFSNGGLADAKGGEGREFADRVYGTLRTGAARTTAEGQQVRLTADPVAAAKSPAVDRSIRTEAASRGTERVALAGAATDPIECPATAACDFQPAAYAAANGDYGNYTLANRSEQNPQDVQYIVIHDTEGGYAGSLATFQNPANQSSAHYLLRSSDGHITQMVADKNIAWHAGNKTVNQHSIGIEHEGYALSGASWYSEQLYQSSASLTSYLAAKYRIPLDREHIIGHDEVPGPTQSAVAGMHWDPGTFWDWNHYMDLVGGRPAADRGYTIGGRVVISPPFSNAYRPTVNGAPLQPANFVYLYSSPNGPLIGNGTQNAADWSDKAVAGASYVVADIQSNWTAIWYNGQKAWFWNDGSIASADNRLGQYVLTPKKSTGSIALYGRSYPEDAAYGPAGVPVPSPNISPLDAVLPAGQSYVPLSSGNNNSGVPVAQVAGDTYYAPNLNDVAKTVTGSQRYYPIHYNHRLAYVSADDVNVVPAATNMLSSGERVQLYTQNTGGPQNAGANYTRGVWETYHPVAYASPLQVANPSETDAMTYTGGQLHAVALSNGHLYTADRNLVNGVWSPWYDLEVAGAGGTLPTPATEVTVVTMGNTMHVLVLVGGRLQEAIADYTTGAWRPWADVSGAIGLPAGALTKITAAVNGNVLHIDGMGTDGRVHVAEGDYNRGGWSYGDISGMAGVLNEPVVNLTTVTTGNKQHLLALTPTGRIWQATADYTAGKWTTWADVTQATGGGITVTKLAATYTGTTLRLFGLTSAGRVYNANGDYARGTWAGWLDVGVPGAAGNAAPATNLAVAGTN